jgi:hypothetical protein
MCQTPFQFQLHDQKNAAPSNVRISSVEAIKNLQNPKMLLGFAVVVSKKANQNGIAATYRCAEKVGRGQMNVSSATMRAHEKLLKLSMDFRSEDLRTYSCKRIFVVGSYYRRTFKAAVADWAGRR